MKYAEIHLLTEAVFRLANFEITNLNIDPESTEYGACSFELNHQIVVFRVAKITPTKVGQFVTHWKRNQDGITTPFHTSDDIDFSIICTRKEDHFGAFIFPKSILLEKGILANETKDGKRGFRVYPPWDIAINKQAKQTQEWQLKYFFKLTSEIEKVALLFRK